MNIGDEVYWVYSTTNYGKQVPCSMCFGKRFVEVILGDNSVVKSECGFCQRGCDRASGNMTIWTDFTEIRHGKITGISMRDGVRYEVGRETLWAYETYPTKEAAEIVYAEKDKEAKERAAECFRESFVNCTKKQIWSVGYHKGCIERAERTIEWHQSRLGMIKELK